MHETPKQKTSDKYMPYIGGAVFFALLFLLIGSVFMITSLEGKYKNAYILKTYVHETSIETVHSNSHSYHEYTGMVIFSYDEGLCNINVVKSSDIKYIQSVLDDIYPIDTEHEIFVKQRTCHVLDSESYNFETISTYNYGLIMVTSSIIIFVTGIVLCEM